MTQTLSTSKARTMNKCYVTSVRVFEDKLVKRVRGHGRKKVGQRRDRGVLAPAGSCPPDGDCSQTPTHIAGSVCGH